MLQTRLDVKLGQRQVLTPGLMQMVGVLALNHLELKDMIHNELVENPVLEEIDLHVESLEEQAGREGDYQRTADTATPKAEAKDPFDEIDFGSYFKDFLDPGFRSPSTFEEYDKPSFEHFLAASASLSDHLLWQLHALRLDANVRAVLEWMIGNLDEDGYLAVSDDEIVAMGEGTLWRDTEAAHTCLHAAREHWVRLDPVGVGARNLSECLQVQLRALRADRERRGVLAEEDRQVLHTAELIAASHLPMLQRRDARELSRASRRSLSEVEAAVEILRSLDPRPGARFNAPSARLIQPDVTFERRGDAWAVIMEEEDLPSLRLNPEYRRMLVGQNPSTAEREVREYVKERYRSAVQLLRSLQQRKSTIARVCDVIVRRQGEFLEQGLDALRPMMIKEVADEIGVHASTVSRAVANKYVHTPQGVLELRFFFSEGVNGPEGGELPLPLLKRKVRKLIEDENAAKPLTDEALAAELQRQGIQVNRRTVAKYREEMGIASTHGRRRR